MDITPNSSVGRLYLHLPSKVDEILKGRYRYINIWLAINGAEQDCSLVLCDARTMNDDDLVPTDIVFPHFCDENFEVRYNPNHRWYHKKGMKEDDAVVFQLYDSESSRAKSKEDALDPRLDLSLLTL